MIWYIAHLVFISKTVSDKILATEEMWLLPAKNDQEASGIANGQLAEMATKENQKAFKGCRKIIKISNPIEFELYEEPPKDGTELTYFRIEVDKASEVDDLVHNKPVKLSWID